MKTNLYMSSSDCFGFPRELVFKQGEFSVSKRVPRIQLEQNFKTKLIEIKVKYRGAIALYLTSPKWRMIYL